MESIRKKAPLGKNRSECERARECPAGIGFKESSCWGGELGGRRSVRGSSFSEGRGQVALTLVALLTLAALFATCVGYIPA